MSEPAPPATDAQRSSARGVGRHASHEASSPGAAMLAVADWCSLLAFVVGGLRSHDSAVIAEVALRNVIPLIVTWIPISLAVGTYRHRDLSSMLITWAIAVPVALLVRTWWVGSPAGGRIVVFLFVGLLFTLVFLAMGRIVVGTMTRSRPVWRRRP